MKYLLGILVVLNTGLFLWGMGQREFISGPHAPARELNPELMQLVPPPPQDTLKKVTLEAQSVAPGSVSEESSTSIDIAPISPDESAGTGQQMAVDDTSESARQCLAIGPYATALERDRSARQLQEMKITSTSNENPQGRLQGYRVFQGPFDTDADLGRARRRLERSGVSDLFFLRDESQRHYISLGFFSNYKSAEDFVRDFKARGVKAKQRTEYATTYWLQVADPEAMERLDRDDTIPLPQSVTRTLEACQ